VDKYPEKDYGFTDSHPATLQNDRLNMSLCNIETMILTEMGQTATRTSNGEEN
jgi:hypothetical protein